MEGLELAGTDANRGSGDENRAGQCIEHSGNGNVEANCGPRTGNGDLEGVVLETEGDGATNGANGILALDQGSESSSDLLVRRSNRRKIKKFADLKPLAFGELETTKRRRSTKRNNPNQVLPNASMFVGYCEDNETIEMIMKKFESLEKIKKEKLITKEISADAIDTKNNSKNAMVTGDDVLDEATLEKVFQETSSFSLEHATREMYREDCPDMIIDEDYYGLDLGDATTAETAGGETLFFFGDGTDDDDLWEEVFGSNGKKSSKRKRAAGSGVSRKPKTADSSGVTQVAFVSDMHNHFITGLKKIRMIDPNAISYLKIPVNITQFWAKKISAYAPRTAKHVHTAWRAGSLTANEDDFAVMTKAPPFCLPLEVSRILDNDWLSQVDHRGPFEGIVLSPPWKSARLPLFGDDSRSRVGSDNPNNSIERGIQPEDLLKLSLNNSALMTSGFVYIWTPKHLILRVLRTLECMDLHYVENAVFVKQTVSNRLWYEDSRYFRQSKETLLICRRGKKQSMSGKISWAPVEIRHQRSPDVHLNFLRFEKTSDGKRWKHATPHSYVHNMAETMLPHGRHNPMPSLDVNGTERQKADVDTIQESSESRSNSVHGKLLHLWADPLSMRTGWVMVSEQC